jgi:hypothetical protein
MLIRIASGETKPKITTPHAAMSETTTKTRPPLEFSAGSLMLAEFSTKPTAVWRGNVNPSAGAKNGGTLSYTHDVLAHSVWRFVQFYFLLQKYLRPTTACKPTCLKFLPERSIDLSIY